MWVFFKERHLVTLTFQLCNFDLDKESEKTQQSSEPLKDIAHNLAFLLSQLTGKLKF